MNTLHRTADRSYTLLSSPDELRALFALFGFRHRRAAPGSLATDYWSHDGPTGRTVLTLFPSGRLTILGPLPTEIDGVTIQPVESAVTR